MSPCWIACVNVSTWRIRCHVILFSTTFSMYFPICSLPIFLLYEDQSAWPTSPDPCLIFQTHYLLRPMYNHSFHCSYISKWKNPSWPASDLDMQLLLAAVSITEPFASIINSHTHTLVKPIDMATNPPYGQVRCPEWFTKRRLIPPTRATTPWQYCTYDANSIFICGQVCWVPSREILLTRYPRIWSILSMVLAARESIPQN